MSCENLEQAIYQIRMRDEASTVQVTLVFICCVAVGVALISFSYYSVYKSRR